MPWLLATAAIVGAGTFPTARPAVAAPDPGGWQSPPPLDWPEKDPIVWSENVGYLPGGGGITSTGEYRYALPLEVPPGRAGMEPRLSLVYTSRSGNGLAGVGWTLDFGGSQISRCPRTFALDGQAESVEFTEQDALCLDGQRLIQVGGNTPMGDGAEYRTEKDGFAKIVAHGSEYESPESFVLFMKGGTIRTYAALAAHRVRPDDQGLIDTRTVVPVWVLAEERDRDGNAVLYNYDVESEDVFPFGFEYRIRSIEYTAKKSDDGTLEEAPRREVVFQYSEAGTRPDPLFEYNAGVRYVVSRRLSGVSMLAPNPDTKLPVGSYTFWYEQGADVDRSFLAEVRRIDGEGHGDRLWSRTFEWQHPTEPTFTVRESLQPMGYWERDPQLYDADNDGKDELQLGPHFCRTTDPATTAFDDCVVVPNLNEVNRPVDVNGDGRVDSVIITDYNSDPPGFAFGTWNGATGKFDPLPYTALSFMLGEYAPSFIDADGDGRIDGFAPGPVTEEHLVHKPVNADFEWYFFRNNGAGWDEGESYFFPAWYMYERGVEALDVNGDGRGELHTGFQKWLEDPDDGEWHPGPSECSGAPNAHWIYGVYGSPLWTSPGDWSAPYVQGSPCQAMLLDTNGDGLKDRVFVHDEESTVEVNTGTGFLPAAPFPTGILLARRQRDQIQALDIDGDGREDLLSWNEATDTPTFQQIPGAYLHLRKTAGFQRLDLGAPPYNLPPYDPNPPAPPAEPSRSPVILPGDVNGDGLTDLVVYERDRAANTSSVKVLVQDWQPRDVIERVWDEGGTTPRETVFYAAFSTDHPTDPTCQYPSRCMRQGMMTAREHWTHRQDDPAAIRRTAYEFDDARSDLRGRGFLGFGRVRSVDLDSFAEVITTFDHGTMDAAGRYPFAGLPQSTTQITPILSTSTAAAGGAVLPQSNAPITARITRAHYNYEVHPTNGGLTYAVFPTTTRTEEWEQHVVLNADGASLAQDGSAVSLRTRFVDHEIDDLGNVLHQASWTVGGQRCETDSTYQDDLSTWLIGLPTTSSITCNDDGEPLPEPRLTAMAYDGRGHLARVTVEPNHPELMSQTDIARDVYGQVWKVTAAAEGVAPRHTFIAYDDEHLWPRASCNDLSHCSRQLVHPAFGVPVLSEDPSGVQVRYRYDGFGRAREIEPDGSAATLISYQQDPDEPWGIVVVRTSEDGSQSRVRSDEWGRAERSEHLGFDGSVVHRKVTYNLFGQLTEDYRPAIGQAPTAKTVTTYDTLGRALSVIEPNGATTTITNAPFSTTTTDPAGRQSRVLRDVDYRITESAQRLGGQWMATKYFYGVFSQAESVVDPQGNATVIDYDKLGRRIAFDDPDRGMATWSFNAFGELVAETDALGDTTVFDRDVLGRVTWSQHDVNGASTFSYDGLGAAGDRGRLTATSSPDGVYTSYEHDDLGRVTHTRWQLGTRIYDVDRDYDSLGRLSVVRYPQVAGRPRFTVGYTHNAQGYTNHVLDLTDPNLPKPIWNVEARSADGLLQSSSSANGFSEARAYDALTGHLTGVEAVKDGTALFAVSYLRDVTGNIFHRSDTSQAQPRHESFAFDDLDRLTRWTVDVDHQANTTLYSYDQLGNLTAITSPQGTETLEHDGVLQGGQLKQPHALTARSMGAASVTYSYDGRGRQTNDGAREIEWKPFDLPSVIHQDGKATTFSYDAFGARLRKARTVSGTGVPVDGVDTVGDLYERRWSAAGDTSHVFTVHGTDGPVAQVVYSGHPSEPSRTLFLHREALGSVGLVTDMDGGEVERTFFDPFGAKVDAAGQPTSPALGEVKLGFTGHRHDDELGLVDMKGRIYDPIQKRFLTPDPFVHQPLFTQSYNRYAYVLNNPLRYTDPTGFQETPQKRQSINQNSDPAQVAAVDDYGCPVAQCPEILVIGKADDTGAAPAQQSSEIVSKSSEKKKDQDPDIIACCPGCLPEVDEKRDYASMAWTGGGGDDDTQVAYRNQGAHRMVRHAGRDWLGEGISAGATGAALVLGPGWGTVVGAMASGGLQFAVGVAMGDEKDTKEGAERLLTFAVVQIASEAVKAGLEKIKTYQTYTKTNPDTGEVYTGRTSGTGTPGNNVKNRDVNHHMNDAGFGPAEPDKSSSSRDAIRGREQMLIEQNGGAKSQGGTSGNAINGVSTKNPNREKYMDAAKKEFGR